MKNPALPEENGLEGGISKLRKLTVLHFHLLFLKEIVSYIYLIEYGSEFPRG